MKRNRADEETPGGQGTFELRVFRHLPLVPCIARDVARQVATPLELGNMMKDGNVGLLEGARIHPRQSSVALPTFLKYCIRGAILEGVRTETPPTRRRVSMSRSVPSTSCVRFETRGAGTRETECGDEFFLSLFGLQRIMKNPGGSALQLSEMRPGDE